MRRRSSQGIWFRGIDSETSRRIEIPFVGHRYPYSVSTAVRGSKYVQAMVIALRKPIRLLIGRRHAWMLLAEVSVLAGSISELILTWYVSDLTTRVCRECRRRHKEARRVQMPSRSNLCATQGLQREWSSN